jgi:hypothetical protein
MSVDHFDSCALMVSQSFLSMVSQFQYLSANQMVWVCDVGTSSGELSANDISALPPSHLRSSISESHLPSQRPVMRRLILPPGDSSITFPLQCKLLVH